MALDLFKFLRGNSKRKKKENYDPSNPLSSTKFLEGMEDTPIQPADPPEVIGRGSTATRRILNAPKPLGGLQRPKTQMKIFRARTKEGKRTGFAEKGGRSVILDMKEDIKKGSSEDKDQKLVFRNRLQSIRNKRKAAAQARYDKQMEARNKRVTAMRAKGGQFRPTNLKREDLETLRQAARDQAFTEPLGRNTALGKATYLTTSGKRQLAMRQRNIARNEAKDKKDNK